MERSESSSPSLRLFTPYSGKRTLYGDQFVDVMKSYFDYVKSQIRIGVEGYDTSINPVDLYMSLEEHFKSCGEVHNIEIDRDPVTNAIKSSSCVVILRGEGAEEKALALNGTEVRGGWNVALKVLPPGLSGLSTGLSTDVLAAQHVAHFQRSKSEGISVTGYDPSVHEDDVKSALSNHFSSCGEITDVFVLNSRALIYFYGLGSVNRAMKLNGTKLGGCELVVKALPFPQPKENNLSDIPTGPPFGASFAQHDSPLRPPFGTSSAAPLGSLDMMDFEYNEPAPGI